MNKKAQLGGYLLKWIPTLFFIIVVSLALVFLLSRFIDIDANTFPAEADLFYDAIVYGRGGLSYVDVETNRIYPGIIDQKKLDVNLEQTITYGEQFLAAKISVGDKVAYYDETQYELLNSKLKSGATKGLPKSKTINKNFILKTNEGTENVEVEIIILQENNK